MKLQITINLEPQTLWSEVDTMVCERLITPRVKAWFPELLQADVLSVDYKVDDAKTA